MSTLGELDPGVQTRSLLGAYCEGEGVKACGRLEAYVLATQHCSMLWNAVMTQT